MNKFLLIVTLIFCINILLHAQQKPVTIASVQMSQELDLHGQQRQFIRDSIIVVWQKERKEKSERWVKFLALMNTRQQMRARRWYLLHHHR